MVHTGDRIYVGQLLVKRSDLPLEFKFLIKDAEGQVAVNEGGDKRKGTVGKGAVAALFDSAFVYPVATYRTAGVAIPVSGIRSKEQMGMGEFPDLKLMVDWCVKTGLQMIQILPINDSGEDPSPYSASSSFALHPSYIRPLEVCEYYEKTLGLDLAGIRGWATGLVAKLNGNLRIDHPRVMAEKGKLIEAIYDKVGQKAAMADPEFCKWLEESKSWSQTYAAFKVTLAKERGFNNKFHDCTTWRSRASDAPAITDPMGAEFDPVARVYFIQYHLHRQLLDATRYAEMNGVALKGDIPIGVTRCSADVWAEPRNFKLDRNAGSLCGRSTLNLKPGLTRFPPYNWDEMHKDNCNWRLKHMEQYFHAYRIDHVLGFFRMWEIPSRGGPGEYVPSKGLREAGLRNLRAIQTASKSHPRPPPRLHQNRQHTPFGVLGLRIQRWCEGHTWKYDYLSVAASSCHDCSPCRLWWNQEWGSAEGWYNFFIGKGQCPGGPPDWVIQKIVNLHLESTSMLTINPIQDYIDCWDALRSPDPKNDMINVPGSTEGCWIWRCHKNMEDLIKEDPFNGFLKGMVTKAQRGHAY
ncbi:glycoside hydrolase [Baffinella frigidus]|nr:glycoside hydrolase [Cryptophyta sp. CCMP2293]